MERVEAKKSNFYEYSYLVLISFPSSSYSTLQTSKPQQPKPFYILHKRELRLAITFNPNQDERVWRMVKVHILHHIFLTDSLLQARDRCEGSFRTFFQKRAL